MIMITSIQKRRKFFIHLAPYVMLHHVTNLSMVKRRRCSYFLLLTASGRLLKWLLFWMYVCVRLLTITTKSTATTTKTSITEANEIVNRIRLLASSSFIGLWWARWVKKKLITCSTYAIYYIQMQITQRTTTEQAIEA